MQIIGKIILKTALATLIYLATFLSISRVGEVSPIVEVPVVVATSTPIVKKPVKAVPHDPQAIILPEIFKKIAWCESKNMQFNIDGTVHRGVQNPQDVGKYQINEHYHLKASQALGEDIYTLEGNTAYALRLYRTNGTRDWNWSKWCWDDQTVSSSTWAIRFKQNL